MWVGVNAVTHKSFYEAAAAEVASGRLDSALWIKVNAELPGADNSARQAKYIALRAQEMATESAGTTVRRWMPRTWWQWGLYLLVVFVGANLIAMFVAMMSPQSNTPYVLVWVFIAAGIALPFVFKPRRTIT